MQLHIMPEKIIHEKMRYVCKQMKLQCAQRLQDKVGTYAYVLMDAKYRKYLFACKRYIDWSPKSWGRVSFTKSLVDLALQRGYTLVMLIEDKDDGEPRNYIYTYNPRQITEHENTYPNIFNGQEMINFNIELALNMEITRRREILKTRVDIQQKTKPTQKDVMEITLRRFT